MIYDGCAYNGVLFLMYTSKMRNLQNDCLLLPNCFYLLIDAGYWLHISATGGPTALPLQRI
jgi:hypothetical protein